MQVCICSNLKLSLLSTHFKWTPIPSLEIKLSFPRNLEIQVQEAITLKRVQSRIVQKFMAEWNGINHLETILPSSQLLDQLTTKFQRNKWQRGMLKLSLNSKAPYQWIKWTILGPELTLFMKKWTKARWEAFLEVKCLIWSRQIRGSFFLGQELIIMKPMSIYQATKSCSQLSPSKNEIESTRAWLVLKLTTLLFIKNFTEASDLGTQ